MMKQIKWKTLTLLIGIVEVLFPAKMVLAGPPFITNDPVPEEYHHADIYLYSFISRIPQYVAAQAPAIELQYGVIPDLELNSTIPIAEAITLDHNYTGGVGLGDIQLGFTYRFVHESDSLPQISFVPTYFVPTGDVNRSLGNGKPWLMIPFSAQKSWGQWTSYASIGYALNSAPLMNNFLFAGLVVQKTINEKITLGGEIYSQGASSYIVPSSTIINLGGEYNFSKSLSFLFSAGHSVVGNSTFVTYLGLDWSV